MLHNGYNLNFQAEYSNLSKNYVNFAKLSNYTCNYT